jgi:hypothetical protein
VHSLSARSFKVRHVEGDWRKEGFGVVRYLDVDFDLVSKVFTTLNCGSKCRRFRGQTRLKLIETEST